jgi:hypothetical protein
MAVEDTGERADPFAGTAVGIDVDLDRKPSEFRHRRR